MGKRQNHRWTTKERNLIANSQTLTDRQIGEIIGVEASKVKAFRRRSNLAKSPQFIEYCRKNNAELGGGRPSQK